MEEPQGPKMSAQSCPLHSSASKLYERRAAAFGSWIANLGYAGPDGPPDRGA